MIKKILLISILSSAIISCASQDSKQVAVMQKKDKNLSCTEVLLEMNEAEFYGKLAKQNKDPAMKNIIAPIGYVSTYMDAEVAIDSSNNRVQYLERIYQILNCDKQNTVIAQASSQQPQIASNVSYQYPANMQYYYAGY